MRNENGFAMADALVAMIIASLFSISLIAANTLMLRSINNACARLHATLLAKSLIEEQPTEATGERLIDGKNYIWTRNVNARAASSKMPAIRREDISIIVQWRGVIAIQQIEITTTRLRQRDA